MLVTHSAFLNFEFVRVFVTVRIQNSLNSFLYKNMLYKKIEAFAKNKPN